MLDRVASPPTTMSLPVESSPCKDDSQPIQQRKTYSSAVQSKQSLSKHHLDISVIDGNQTIQIPDDIFEDSAPLWEDFLIGKFLATTAPHVAKIHVIVNKIWSLGDKSVRIDVFEVNQSTVKFRIRELEIRERVLRRGMWNIADIPMVVSKWSPITEESQPDIKTIPMWVIIKHVPHKMFSWKGLGFLASAVGDPKRLHPDTVLCKNFEEAKVFVEADLSKDLPKSFRFQSDKGVDSVVEFQYPWLPPKCSVCSKWGHFKEVCIINKGKQVCEIVIQPPKIQEVALEEKQVSTQGAKTATDKSDKSQENNPPGVEHETAILEKETLSTVPEIETRTQENMQSQESEEIWHSVSPNRVKRHYDNSVRDVVGFDVSPSRFSILEEENEVNSEVEVLQGENVQESAATDQRKIVEDDVEEGEIAIQPAITSSSSSEVKIDNTRIMEELTVRPSLPRVSKAKSESSSQVATDRNPSAWKKRSSKKKP